MSIHTILMLAEKENDHLHYFMHISSDITLSLPECWMQSHNEATTHLWRVPAVEPSYSFDHLLCPFWFSLHCI